MVLLVLVVLWIVVLAPGLIKKRSERQSNTSIDSFHRELHLLERSGPRRRVQSAEAGAGSGSSATGLPTITSRPGRPKLVLVGRNGLLEEPMGAEPSVSKDSQGTADPSMVSRGRADSYQRRQVLKRRRDIFVALVATLVFTALLGAVHSLRLLWVITVLSAIALAAYVVLMGQVRRMEMEKRESQWTRRAKAAAQSYATDRHGVELAEYRPADEVDYAEPEYEMDYGAYGEPQRALAVR